MGINSIFCLVYCFVSFTFTYGNALSAQDKYIEFRVTQVLDVLNELEIMNTPNLKYLKLISAMNQKVLMS